MYCRNLFPVEKWLYSTFDIVPITGDGSYSFFHGNKIHVSNQDLRMAEKAATSFILEKFEGKLLELLNANPETSFLKKEIVEPFTRKDWVPGDIDLIIFDSKRPNNTTALEIKVLRKNQGKDNNDYLEGFRKIREGVEQSKGLLRLGFWSVALVVVVLANVSNQIEKNLVSRSIGLRNWEKIRREAMKHIGHEKIGLINIEINQNSEKDVGDRGNIGGILISRPLNEQKQDITEKSMRVLRERKVGAKEGG